MPTPRNDRVATVKIAYPNRTVSSTTIGPGDVGQDLADHDEQARLTAQPGRRHVIELALGEDRGPDRPGDDRREQDADDADDDDRRRPEDDQGEQRDHDDRQRQERLDDPAHDVVDGPR